MKVALLQGDASLLRRALQIPDEAEIADIRMSLLSRGAVEIVLHGAGWETKEGDLMTRAPAGEINEAGVIDWHLPPA